MAVLEFCYPPRAGNRPRIEAAELFQRIRDKDISAVEQLYAYIGCALYAKSVAAGLDPGDREDVCHDVYMTVISAIQREVIREPEALLGYTATILRRKIIDRLKHKNSYQDLVATDHIKALIDKRQTPDEEAISIQRKQLMGRGFASLKPIDREILQRFYLQQQTKERIVADLNLTQTEFRLRKTRALQRVKREVAKIRTRGAQSAKCLFRLGESHWA